MVQNVLHTSHHSSLELHQWFDSPFQRYVGSLIWIQPPPINVILASLRSWAISTGCCPHPWMCAILVNPTIPKCFIKYEWIKQLESPSDEWTTLFQTMVAFQEIDTFDYLIIYLIKCDWTKKPKIGTNLFRSLHAFVCSSYTIHCGTGNALNSQILHNLCNYANIAIV